MVLYYWVGSAAELVSSKGFEDVALFIFDSLGITALLSWQVSEFVIYWLIAVYFFPIFSLIVCSDQTCSDRSRGTLRFISLRSTRTEILLGRFLGQFLIVLSLIMFTVIATILFSVLRDSHLLLPSFSRGLRLFFELIIIISPYIAFMSLLNSYFKSSKTTIIFCLLFFTLGSLFVSLIGFVFGSELGLRYFSPGVQIDSMISLQTFHFSHYLIPIGQSILYLALANLAFKRSAL
jgi:ABC-type transport system involved in multi-copper enzyme maturation permease subunit